MVQSASQKEERPGWKERKKRGVGGEKGGKKGTPKREAWGKLGVAPSLSQLGTYTMDFGAALMDFGAKVPLPLMHFGAALMDFGAEVMHFGAALMDFGAGNPSPLMRFKVHQWISEQGSHQPMHFGAGLCVSEQRCTLVIAI